MAFQSVPNTAQANFQFLQNNKEVEITAAFWRSGGYDLGDLEDLAAALDLWAGQGLVGNFSNQVTYLRTVVRGLENENDYEVVESANAGAGSIVSPPLPNSNALAISRRSAFTGRSARGRVYMIGIPTSAQQSDENFVTNTYAQTVALAFEDMMAIASTAGWAHVIVSRESGGAPRPVGIVFFVTGYQVVDLRLDSQRGRMPK